MHIRTLILSFSLALASLSAGAQTPEPRTHVVQRGETLEFIANSYGVSTDAILEVNPLAKEMFFIGMKLTIPASAASNAADAGRHDAAGGEASPKENTDEDSDSESTYQPGLALSDFRGSYYFPTKKEPSPKAGEYKASYTVSFEMNGIYRFPHRVFTKFGLGVNVESASAKLVSIDQSYYSETSYVHLYVPIRVGYQIPLWKRAHLDLYTGAHLGCLVGGYEQYRTDSREKWNKTKVKHMKNKKRFHASWTAGADLNFGSFGIGCEYLHTLEHKPLKGLDKGAIAATLFFSLD